MGPGGLNFRVGDRDSPTAGELKPYGSASVPGSWYSRRRPLWTIQSLPANQRPNSLNHIVVAWFGRQAEHRDAVILGGSEEHRVAKIKVQR